MSQFTFAAAGDAIITRRCSHRQDRPFLDLVELIRGADAAFVNFEVVTPGEPLVPSAEHGGVNLGVPEYVIDELKWMGFNLFGIANNHSNDFTHTGLVDTMGALRRRDVNYAGGGMNLGEARSPTYMQTLPGRIGLVATASSYTVGAPAAPVREDMPGRPGISYLRTTYEYVLDADRFQRISEISEALGIAEAIRERHRRQRTSPDEGIVDILGAKFAIGEFPNVLCRINPKDLEDVCRWINDASRQAQLVVVSVHTHQGKGRGTNTQEIAPFMQEVAHQCIDAGAGVVVGHGPHVLRGIEIYSNRPIFYSLGNFFYLSSMVTRYPAEIYEMLGLNQGSTPADVVDARTADPEGNPRGFNTDMRFWHSVIPICRFKEWNLETVDLFPIELCLDAPHRAQRGEPQLANAETGKAILDNLAELSKPFGVGIIIDHIGDRVVGRASWL